MFFKKKKEEIKQQYEEEIWINVNGFADYHGIFSNERIKLLDFIVSENEKLFIDYKWILHYEEYNPDGYIPSKRIYWVDIKTNEHKAVNDLIQGFLNDEFYFEKEIETSHNVFGSYRNIATGIVLKRKE